MAGTRASFGAVQGRLQYSINALEVQHEGLETARSHIVDVDIAEEVAKLAQGQILQDAAVSVVAQANAGARRALRLLDTSSLGSYLFAITSLRASAGFTCFRFEPQSAGCAAAGEPIN